MSALDRYDEGEMDDEAYSEISIDERRAAEQTMNRRDRAAGIMRDDLLYGNKICLHKVCIKKNFFL